MMAFAYAMRDAGIDPPEAIVADGRMHRFDVPGDGPKKKNGWYVLFQDPPAGAFGCWKRGIKETWHEAKEVSREERAAFRAKMEEEKRRRHEEAARMKEACRRKAAQIWRKALPADHPYLQRKGVKGYGTRVYSGSLVVPVRDSDGMLHGLQFIGADGQKKFLTNTAKAGCYFSIGEMGGRLCIAEGFATAASIHECTGYPVAVAFDAGNLLPVGKVLRAKFPAVRLVFCADNDASGVGEEMAGTAARECGGVVVMPPAVGEDFNDYHQRIGREAVKALFEGG